MRMRLSEPDFNSGERSPEFFITFCEQRFCKLLTTNRRSGIIIVQTKVL